MNIATITNILSRAHLLRQQTRELEKSKQQFATEYQKFIASITIEDANLSGYFEKTDLITSVGARVIALNNGGIGCLLTPNEENCRACKPFVYFKIRLDDTTFVTRKIHYVCGADFGRERITEVIRLKQHCGISTLFTGDVDHSHRTELEREGIFQYRYGLPQFWAEGLAGKTENGYWDIGPDHPFISQTELCLDTFC